MDVFWILSLCVCVNAYIALHMHYNGVKKQVSAKQTAAIQTGSSKQTLPLRIAKCNAVSFKCCMGGPGVRSQLFFVHSVRRGDQRLQRFRWKLQILLSEEEASSFSWAFCVKILLFKFKKKDLVSNLQRWPVSLKHGQEPGSSLQHKIRPCVLQKQLV